MNFLTAKAKKIFVTLRHLPRALKLIWRAGKVLTIIQILLLLMRGVFPAILVYLTKFFVDALVAAINESADYANIQRVIWFGIAFGVITLLSEVSSSVSAMIYTAHAERLSDIIFALIHEKSVKADIAFYEQPEFFDHLHRARSEAHQRPLELINQFGSLLQNSVTMISMAIILLRYGIWLPIVLLATALPTFYVVLYSSSRMHRWERGKTSLRRRSYYYDWLLTNGETAAELRLFDLGEHFKRKFVETRIKLLSEQFRLGLRQRLLEFAAGFTALGITAAVFFWIIRRTIQGTGTLGDLALFYQIFNQGRSLIRSFLSDIGRLYANSLFLGDLFEYLDLQPQIVSPPASLAPPLNLQRGISFENVTFRYQTGQKSALEDFSLFIPANKIVAVVGENGAGKSTLIKLLCRFYDPQTGSIKLDETDVRRFSLEELRRMITILFQSPIHYKTTIGENIALGNVALITESEKIKKAAEDAGASEIVEKFPKGYEQMLGHLFAEGGELSGGEWQRIALARAIFREAPIILLDEPTSQMDPWTEAAWLKKFLKSAHGKTILIITHRFTTAMRADFIHVMHNGKIIESGSHAELLRINGRYADSFRQQVNGFSFTDQTD